MDGIFAVYATVFCCIYSSSLLYARDAVRFDIFHLILLSACGVKYAFMIFFATKDCPYYRHTYREEKQIGLRDLIKSF